MYAVNFVSDDAMPDGHDFMVVQVGRDFGAFYRASAISASVIEDSWAAYRLMVDDRLRAAS